MKYKYLCIILASIFCFLCGIQGVYGKTCKYSGNVNEQNITFNIMIQDGTKAGCMWFSANSFIKPGKSTDVCATVEGRQGYTPKLPWENAFYECPNTLYYYGVGYERDSIDERGQKKYLYISTLSNVSPHYFTNYSDIDISSLTDWHSEGTLSRVDVVEEQSGGETTNGGMNYDKLCSDYSSGIGGAARIIGYIVLVAKWLVPIVIIILGIIDFAKAVISSDDKALNKATSSLAKRIVAGLIVFFIPTLLLALLNLLDISNGIENNGRFDACTKCILNASKYCP